MCGKEAAHRPATDDADPHLLNASICNDILRSLQGSEGSAFSV